MVDEQVFPNWVLTLAVRLLGGKGKGMTGRKGIADMAKVTLFNAISMNKMILQLS